MTWLLTSFTVIDSYNIRRPGWQGFLFYVLVSSVNAFISTTRNKSQNLSVAICCAATDRRKSNFFQSKNYFGHIIKFMLKIISTHRKNIGQIIIYKNEISYLQEQQGQVQMAMTEFSGAWEVWLCTVRHFASRSSKDPGSLLTLL